MLVYDITKNKPLGVITDVISGIAVISIAFFMLPIFNPFNKKLSYVYLVCKFVEGTLMIIGGS